MPFDGRTTAAEILQGIDLTGKHYVVTGGNSGLGAETVRVLADAGARVTLCCRNVNDGTKVAAASKAAASKGVVTVQQLDLADLQNVRAAAKNIEKEDRIDGLILNAGVMFAPKGYTKNGFETHIGVNHIGHFYLTQLLTPKLLSQEFKSRLVVLSSVGHMFGSINLQDLHYKHGRRYGFIGPYGQSKLANILFAKEFAQRHKDSRVTALSVHPGIIATNLYRNMGIVKSMWTACMRLVAKSIPQGAATQVLAAVSPDLDGHAGAYLVDCAIATPWAKARDMDMAAKLWDQTEKEIAEALSQKSDAAS